MVLVITHGCCTNNVKLNYAKKVKLVLDSPAYDEPQTILSFEPASTIIIERVNKVDKDSNGFLIVHIA